jgi:hypothetical protein
MKKLTFISRFGFTALFAVGFLVPGAAQVFAAPPVHNASATISPTTASQGQTQTYTYTVTNGATSTADIGSVEIQLPTGFTTPSSITIFSASLGRTWVLGSTGGYVNGYNSTTRKIGIKASGAASELGVNEFVSIQITTTAPAVAGSHEWTAVAWTNLTFNGTAYTITSAQPTVTIPLLSQTITVNTNAPVSATYRSTFPVAATSDSGLAVAITTTGGCSIAGANVTMTSGTTGCVVHYNQAGNASYNAAPEVTETTLAVKQILTITPNDVVSKTYGDTVTFAGTEFTSGGVFAGDSLDSVSLSSPGAAATAAVAGSPYDITASDAVGTGLSNYEIHYNVGHLTVVARPITVTAVTNTKPFDGNTSAAAIPTITAGTLAAGDTGNFSETYDTSAVGTGKTLTPVGTITDSGAADVTTNYSINFVPDTTGVITSVTVTHTITTSTPGGHGSISPSGAVVVNDGEDQSFTITANSGYSISDVLVDGVSQGQVSSYDFLDVAADHTLSATFSAIAVTPATGGEAISADDVGGAYTELTGPVVAEGGNKDIGTGTIVLNVPAGFEFDAGSPVTVAVEDTASSGHSPLILSSNTALVTSTTITITVVTQDAPQGPTKAVSRLTWSGIKVRPTAALPLANGNITNSGTAISTGSVSFGELTEVSVPVIPDTTAPVIEFHDDVTVEATSGAGADVLYTAPNATDDVDPMAPADCLPASGSTFALGTTEITCNKTDEAGNPAEPTTFNIIVEDTTPPEVTVPTNVSIEAGEGGQVIVAFDASATDLVDGDTSVSCDPASGSSFSVGENIVTCTSTDTSGNEGTANFSVIVSDTTGPTLVLPGDITAEATSESGAVVSFEASANDLVDGDVTLECTPASGSEFPLGTTTVDCSASDLADPVNTSTGSFDVTVEDTTGPAIEITSPDEGSTTGVSGTIIYSAGDSVNVTCTLDGDSVECDIGGSFSFGPLSDGGHTFTVQGTDSVGNEGSASVDWNVDATGPTVNITGGPEDGSTVASNSGTFTFTSEEGATFTCTLDGTPEDCDGSLAFGPLSNGPHTFTVFATDTLDTEGAPASVTWTVDVVDSGVTHTLTYAAGNHGSITGNSSQTVNDGEDGTEVTAVADHGFRFLDWSDGVSTASRTDLSVTEDISVTANFESNIGIISGGIAPQVLGASTGGEVLGAEKFVFTKFMKKGSTGDEVTELQKLLQSLGLYWGKIDGKFGPLTEAAVKAFQMAHPPLKVDGIVGPLTRAVLNQ